MQRTEPMRLYCTLFDSNYLTRGVALYGSLQRHCGNFRLVVLCLDEPTHAILSALALPNLQPLALAALEQADPELARVRAQRTLVEYYFTCKPVLMKFAAHRCRDAGSVTYLDSDLFYFSDPAPLEREYAGAAVALTPHRFPARLSARNQYGRFNAGWVSAGTGEEGRRFIDWWRARCIEWCRLEVEAERFGDQKYLDQVPRLFAHVVELHHPGANLAPWNLDGLAIRKTTDAVTVNAEPLVFFHFHGVRKVLGKLYDSGLEGYGVPLSASIREHIYRPYLACLADAELRVAALRKRLRAVVPRTASVSVKDVLRRCRRATQLVASRSGVMGP